MVLDGGRIIERGTHAELIERAGRYAHLYGLQASAYQYAHLYGLQASAYQ